MPQWIFSGIYEQPAARIFAVLSRSANRVRLAPESLSVQVLVGPERIDKGSRLTLRVRRSGVSQNIELEVIEFTPESGFVEEQVRGPFRSWRQRYHLETLAEGGTRLTETIDCESPGGMLGWVMTAGVIERYLRDLHREREPLLRRLLAEPET